MIDTSVINIIIVVINVKVVINVMLLTNVIVNKWAVYKCHIFEYSRSEFRMMLIEQ